ncbi:MAG TPA: outer membrane lipid asymmetry maintenance protein MlaD [Rhodocyclaceae bacterium]|nr:outer membrane lipid asymmetry maintenance protein MlaD [Rhodocyclaceae bacterium]HMV53334.1 outer membrane lipid asymmetry maintenance protein MlaD [Rhodocyclaceae bacterium]HMZ83009.1 outer membrane lipid asymmetry maintenance protein MlaD [Rhodocyclaceae bacterium]HNA03139.1 outer membrane lipid asymmetry maintenance protein MlaD [Rhodocyclaceae bacterium]HNB78449.1 outer membrane lipid asymmetry maintenance protein MlaD [Rhodocyclaceae bacterium]
MNRAVIDLWVGIFVAIGLGALVFLALKVGNLASVSADDSYDLSAKFDNIGGLKIRAPVKSAGVVVGRVSDISFDPANYQAVVVMKVDARFKFPTDTFATINTSGLLGEQYIGFEVGGDPDLLKAGDTIKKTQSAVVLEKLISQFMFNKASESPAPAAAK